MASVSDLKFYKSLNNGLGGAIDLTSQIVSGTDNNLFPIVELAESVAGSTRYLCAYVKNTGSETFRNFTFWKQSGSSSSDTTMQWSKGKEGKNDAEPTIANINTAPSGITFHPTSSEDDDVKFEFGDLGPGDYHGIWFKVIMNANASMMRSDSSVFKFKVDLPPGSTDSPPDESGSGGGSSGGNAPPTNTDYKIAVVGDWDSKSASNNVADLCESCDKIIGVGDYGYGDENGFFDMINDHNLKSKFLGAAPGNHEEDDGYSSYKSFFGLGSGTWCYMKKFENIACITIDSNVNMDDGSSQHNLVEGFLDNASADPNIDWIVACMHHPWFGSGSDHGYNEGDQVQAFHDLFMDHEVAFVFTGHNHNWQRTHKVAYNNGDPEDPSVVDSSSPFTNSDAGLIHVLSGGGGHDTGSGLYDLDDDIGTSGNPNAFQQSSNNGIYELIASNNGKTLTCRFKATDGDTFDTITYTT